MLFVDDGTLAPFVQLATSLRRSGWRTIRVTTAPRSIGSIYTASFAFDRVAHTDMLGIASLDTLLKGERLVDVHAAEPIAVEAYRSLGRRPDSSRAGWGNRADLIDKSKVDAAPGRRRHSAPRRTARDDRPGRRGRGPGSPNRGQAPHRRVRDWGDGHRVRRGAPTPP